MQLIVAACKAKSALCSISAIGPSRSFTPLENLSSITIHSKEREERRIQTQICLAENIYESNFPTFPLSACLRFRSIVVRFIQKEISETWEDKCVSKLTKLEPTNLAKFSFNCSKAYLQIRKRHLVHTTTSMIVFTVCKHGVLIETLNTPTTWEIHSNDESSAHYFLID